MLDFCKIFIKEFKNKSTKDDMFGSFKCFWLIMFFMLFFILLVGSTIILDIR